METKHPIMHTSGHRRTTVRTSLQDRVGERWTAKPGAISRDPGKAGAESKLVKIEPKKPTSHSKPRYEEMDFLAIKEKPLQDKEVCAERIKGHSQGYFDATGASRRSISLKSEAQESRKHAPSVIRTGSRNRGHNHNTNREVP